MKSRCVVTAKLIMAASHRLIPIALLSAPATPIAPDTKGSTDRWDGALWDRVLIWHKKDHQIGFSFLGITELHKYFTVWNIVTFILGCISFLHKDSELL